MIDFSKFSWTPSELPYVINGDSIEVTTLPETDLWQKTFGGKSSDNAPVFQMETEDLMFSFVVKATFEASGLYDQCGIVMHMSENSWLKASMECEGDIKHLGSVATNDGYSDWAAVDVPKDKSVMWYKMTRNNSDFLIEYSEDGVNFSVLRMCHMWNIDTKINVGVYACSPRQSSFKAVFSDFKYETLTEVKE